MFAYWRLSLAWKILLFAGTLWEKKKEDLTLTETSYQHKRMQIVAGPTSLEILCAS